MLKMLLLLVVTVSLMLVVGCSQENQPGQAQTGAEVSEVINSGDGSDTTGNRGRVLTTMDAAGYSYIQVENNGREVWLAGNPVVVKEGDIISWDQSSVMHNFYSKTLDRSFDEILFVSGLKSPSAGEAGPLAASHPPMNVQAMPAVEAEPAGKGVVVSAKNAAGYTYLEIKMADESIVWLAAPEMAVAANDIVEWQAGSKMINFASSSLGKTFPEIYFVPAVNVKK